jgi:hypothetical protein
VKSRIFVLVNIKYFEDIKMKKLLCLLGITVGLVANAQAYNVSDYSNDLATLAQQITAGGDCYHGIKTEIFQRMLKFQIDGTSGNGGELFLTAMNNVEEYIPQNLAYISHLMTFQILNSYFFDTPKQYNSTYCPDNVDTRKLISSNIRNEYILYTYALAQQQK